MTTATMSDRKFGIEIECYGTTMIAACTAIVAAGVECNIERYGHSTPRAWKIVTDASLEDVRGFEVVSPPLSGIPGLEQVHTVAKALVAAGCKVSKHCGFHVHVDATGLSKLELLNVAKRYQTFEAQIDQFMPASRRTNRFCCTMNEFFRNDYAGERLSRALRATTIQNMLRVFGDASCDRYFKLNLQAYLRHGTVEFRQHSGTVNAAKMANWIVFCTNFVDASKIAESSTSTDAPAVRRRGRPRVPGARRVNAMQTKFEKIAALFDRAGAYAPVYATELAHELDIALTSVPAYISAFRSKYPDLQIKARRARYGGTGGYRKLSYGSFVEIVTPGIPPVTLGVQSAAPVAPPVVATLPSVAGDTWHRGLPIEVKSFYEERALELGTC